MNHYQQLIADEILSVQGQKNYCLTVLAVGGLESWQSKEYSELVEQYDKKLIELNNSLPLAGKGNSRMNNWKPWDRTKGRPVTGWVDIRYLDGKEFLRKSAQDCYWGADSLIEFWREA